jgi:colicin V production protein
MIQLSALLWASAIVFGVIGFMRGLSKEMISLSGVILALFALFQFDSLLRKVLLANVPPEQQFLVQTAIFLGIVFFAYQTRALGKRIPGANAPPPAEGRDNLQSTILGAVVGFVNGYLIWGSIWYFMDINGYPLTPFVAAPPQGSPSAQIIASLPLYLLAGGPGGDGNLLALMVIILFIFVLILI